MNTARTKDQNRDLISTLCVSLVVLFLFAHLTSYRRATDKAYSVHSQSVTELIPLASGPNDGVDLLKNVCSGFPSKSLILPVSAYISAPRSSKVNALIHLVFESNIRINAP
jgi:hypothetical protein